MPHPPSFLPSPYGGPIPACYLRDVRDVFVILTAWHKGLFAECTRRLKDSEKHAYITSGWCAIFPPDICGVSRWTDQCKWSPSRVQGPFFVYRQKDASTPRSQRKQRSSPYHDTAASRPRATAPRHSLPSPSCSGSDDEWSAVEFERQLVSSWTDNALFTKNGLCKKSIAIELYGREYRLVSYYNPLDVHHGKLTRASEHPSYVGLELDPMMLREAKFKTREKNDIRIHLLADLLNGGRPKGMGEPVQHDFDASYGYASPSDSTVSSIYSPTQSESSSSPRSSSLTSLSSQSTHGLGLNHPDIHWVPIEPAQSSQMATPMLQLSGQQYMKHEADVDDNATLRPISRVQHFVPARWTPGVMDGIVHKTPSPPPSPSPESPAVGKIVTGSYIYELSNAFIPTSRMRPSRQPPQPARINTGVSYHQPTTTAAATYAAPLNFATAGMAYPMVSTAAASMPAPLQYNFPPTPPQSAMGSQNSPSSSVYIPYYPIADDFMPMLAQPLDLSMPPDTPFNFDLHSPVSEAHGNIPRVAPHPHSHTRF
ncbi:hypothetical protein AURDEDRAFT_179307 [Auricularia subglabra TFB-10046 SS5]|nr:hypothetical protein AURDEDRAFT_179307 [Auricularia subglabra TFB-10046 SS5]